MTIIIFSLFVYYLIKKRYNHIFAIFIFINIAIPRNDNLEYLIKFNLLFDTRLIYLLLMLLILLFKVKKFLFTKFEVAIYILLTGIIAIGAFIGRDNLFFTYDIKLISSLVLSYFVFIKWIKVFDIKIKNVLKIFIINSIIYSLSTIIIFIFFRGEFLAYIYGDIYGSIWGDRVTFSNNTAQYIWIFLSIYYIYLNKELPLNYISVILNFISILMAQNRTIITLFLLMLFVIVVILSFEKFKRGVSLLFLGISCIVLSLSVCFFYIFSDNLLGNNKLLGDLVSRFNNEGSGTLVYREITNKYAIESVEDNKFLGEGLGKEIWSGGNLSNRYIGSFIDNVFVSIYVKLGIIGSGFIILFFIYGIVQLLKAFILSRSILSLLLLLLYPGYLIGSTYMTSQFIHSPPVYFTLFLLLVVSQDQLNIIKNNNEETRN